MEPRYIGAGESKETIACALEGDPFMTSMSATDQAPGYGTYRYRTYVLGALALIYVLNFVDRVC